MLQTDRLLVLLLLVLALTVYWSLRDLLRALLTYCFRRNLGAFKDDRACLDAIRNVGLNWLMHVPPLESRDVSATVLDIMAALRNRGLAAFRNRLKYSWPQAVLAKGIGVCFECSGNPDELRVLRAYCDRFLRHATTPDGEILLRHFDEGMHGELLLLVYQATQQVRYREAATAIARYYVTRAAAEGGTVPYQYSGPSAPRYVDALPMMCPFLATYGTRFDDQAALDLAVLQLAEFARYGLDARTGLPYHIYDPATGNAPGGLLGWGRGVGWYALGLVDTLAALPLASAHRPRLIESATNLRQSVLRFQRPDGGWGALLTVSGSEYDSSATALLGYFLLRTSSLGLAPVATPVPSVQRAIASLRARTRANGQVDFSQGSCIGLDRMSQRYAPTPYTQGMAIAVFSLNTNTGIGA